jgi:hypothetical protein
MGTTLETEWKRKMGLFLPIVGYVAARNHNPGGQESEWDKKRRAAVEMFVGGIRMAYLEGWGDILSPLTKRISVKETNVLVHQKTYEHRIFVDTDLKNRPQMKEMIDFIMSEPEGGTICVIDKKDLFDAIEGQYNPTQCRTIKLLPQIPVLECGTKEMPGSLMKKLMGGYGNSQVIREIVTSALYLRDAHTRRLGASEFKKRLCDMDKADLRDPTAYRAMSEAYEAGILCPKCEEKWVSHQNVINPHARPIPPHKTP